MAHPHSSNVTTVTEESCQHWATTQNCFVLIFLTNWDWNHNGEKKEADLRPTKMGKSIIPWWFCRLGPPWDMSQHLQSDLRTICQVQWGFHHRGFAPIQVPPLCPSTLAKAWNRLLLHLPLPCNTQQNHLVTCPPIKLLYMVLEILCILLHSCLIGGANQHNRMSLKKIWILDWMPLHLQNSYLWLLLYWLPQNNKMFLRTCSFIWIHLPFSSPILLGSSWGYSRVSNCKHLGRTDLPHCGF